MMITRRTVLLSVTAGVAFGTTPIAPSVAAIPESPIIRLHERSAVFCRPVYPIPVNPFDIVACYTGEISPVPIEFREFLVSAKNGQRVASVEDAEDKLLAAIGDPTATAYLPPQQWVPTCGDIHVSLMIAINRGSNLIAARTRIGTADTVLMSPIGFEVLLDHSSRYVAVGMFNFAADPKKVGRWRITGSLNWCGQTFEVFVGDHLPDDRVYVIRIAGDDHAALIRHDGSMYLATDVEDAATQSTDFFYCLSVQPCLDGQRRRWRSPCGDAILRSMCPDRL